MPRYLSALLVSAGLFATLASAQPAPAPAPQTPPAPVDHAISAEERSAAVDAALEAVKNSYVFPDAAEQMATVVRASQKKGDYDKLDGAVAFAARLTTDLQSINGDKHLRVRLLPPNGSAAGPMTPENAAKTGYGVARAEVLPGNIGYVDLRLFFQVEMARDALVAAMNKVAGTRAIIFDLRKHRGGDPATVSFLASYLFGSERVHLNSIYRRTDGSTTPFYTNPNVPGEHFGPDKPVYLLTSSGTFSGGEEFAYDLQTQKRATLFGETTGGGANPGGGRPLPGGLSIFVPNGRAINPITKTNWEGVGVKPDRPMPAAEAFAAAYRELLGKIDLSKETPESRAAIAKALKDPKSVE